MEKWDTTTDRPGYRYKTVNTGNATIIICRPILSEAEAEKAQEKVRTALECAMRERLKRA